MKIGVLAFQGGVAEHLSALNKAAEKLKLDCTITKIKRKSDFVNLDGLIIPGGESTTLWKLIERERIEDDIKNVKAIFGTCAGSIIIAKKVKGLIDGQKSIGLMDIETDRNAYGSQIESFEADVKTELGDIHAVFIRAPKIRITKRVTALARYKNEIISAEQRTKNRFYLATTFHPELTTTIFHEYFLKSIRYLAIRRTK